MKKKTQCHNKLNLFTSKKRYREIPTRKSDTLTIPENLEKDITPKKRQYRKKKCIYQKDSQKMSQENQELKTENKPQIDFCKTVFASERDFHNPISYFDSLWDEKTESTGIIKVIPPKIWKDTQIDIFNDIYYPNITESSKKLETRLQQLNKLFYGKKFEYATEFTFIEFQHFAAIFESEMMEKLSITDIASDHAYEIIEDTFWQLCKQNYGTISSSSSLNNIPDDLKVRYAADIPYKKYLNKKTTREILARLKKSNAWNLFSLKHEKDSLFQFLQEKENENICGLTIPWLYFGMLFSAFCWHVEDQYLYSLNYNHSGSAKIWYGISHTQKEKMDDYIKRKCDELSIEDPSIIHKLVLLIDPHELKENGIKVYKAVQNPGEIVMTVPKGYHCGFSSGFNIGEAVNFASSKWIEFGVKAQVDYNKSLDKMPVFSFEWLLQQACQYKKMQFSSVKTANNLSEHLSILIKWELKQRSKLERYLQIHKVEYKVVVLPDTESYSKSECKLCAHYGFFSYFKCKKCHLIICLRHTKPQCTCENSEFVIHYRNLEKNLIK